MAMTHKERIDAVLDFRPVDRTPFALVDGGAWIAKSEGLTYRQMYGSEDGGASLIVKYTDEIDTDMVSAVSGVFTAPLNAFGCSIAIDESGSPVNTGTCISDPDTEIPKLDKSDIREKLLANEFFQGMLRQCENVNKLAGDRKYLFGDIAGPFTDASVMLGTAKFLKLMRKKPDLLRILMDYTTEICTEIYRLLGERGCSCTFVAEPVASGTMISPQMYEEWALPALVNVKNNLPDYKYFFAHICGASQARVIPLRDAGFHAFSCDYLVDEAQFLADADKKIVMFGNLEPAGRLLMGTADEVYKEACEHIEISKGYGYIIAPGCDLGAASPFENVAAMGKACKDLAFQ